MSAGVFASTGKNQGASAVQLGAVLRNGVAEFLVWSPHRSAVQVWLQAPESRTAELQKTESGYFYGSLDGVPEGATYYYLLDGELRRPDPASRFQPQGVHGPSALLEDHFSWTDAQWTGIPLSEYVIYELHVGTFTQAGTLDAIIDDLERLAKLGVTAIELMPLAEFPGGRNWGYDGVFPFAVDASYGGPEALKRLVDACHALGMAVILDVVYNHLGPEGNYLRDFGPYFNPQYNTPWGEALNFDSQRSEGVRRFFLENALMWVTDYHVDALRLDAVHAIYDRSAVPFLKELADEVHQRGDQLGRRIHLIAESDLNDARLLRPWEAGGCGLDAQWSDDFHHALHTVLTGERDGYYMDFGPLAHLAKSLERGWSYDGSYSQHRLRRHGNSPAGLDGSSFLICTQNHDQIGNRMLGDRLSTLVSYEQLKLAAAAMLLAPYIPLLFMGEEYGETNPFLYFVSHGDPDLVNAVREGRKAEFAAFTWLGEAPDPQSESTFERSKLNRSLLSQDKHRVLHDWYEELIRLRKSHPALRGLSKENQRIRFFEELQTLEMERWDGTQRILAAFNFAAARRDPPSLPAGWKQLLHSAGEQWRGRGAEGFPPHSCIVYEGSGA